MDNKNHKQSDMKDQKNRVEKKDQRHNDKSEKMENKVDRPVKWAKNKHTFVVAGIIHNFYYNL